MKLFSFYKSGKQFLTQEENQRIISAIRNSELQTCGEIRVFIESKNPLMSPLERAAGIFYRLKMEETEHRNAVLVYIAYKHKEVALFGDEGINNLVGEEYWKSKIRMMLNYFKGKSLAAGIEQCVVEIGNTLKEKFPYNPSEDKNELPDEIVFGK
ncbi:MAG: TPM domain-containing protein [Ferruginibacter sp.]|nr:TPM domain-containing protein [Ferruginibacter sp.]